MNIVHFDQIQMSMIHFEPLHFGIGGDSTLYWQPPLFSVAIGNERTAINIGGYDSGGNVDDYWEIVESGTPEYMIHVQIGLTNEPINIGLTAATTDDDTENF